MSTWTEEFSAFQSSTASGGIGGGNSSSTVGAKRSPSRKDKIEAELKLLEWHKLANDAAIKAALMQNKQLRTETVAKKPNYTEDDARWIRTVIEHEHVKPMEVNRQFVLEAERREQENMNRLNDQVDRHIHTLAKLRGKLEERHDLKSRTEEFKQWKKEFSVKKQAVMIGKTLEEIEMMKNNPETDSEDRGSKKFNPQLSSRNSNSELNTVLDSLNKLADLEKRITSLEKDNEYDVLLSKERGTANERTSFEFRKKRTPLEEGALGLIYTIKPKKTSWNVKIPGMKTGAGTGVAAVRAKQQQQKGGGGGGGGGVFLTGMDETDQNPEDRRAANRRERQKQLAMASDGKKNIRSRVMVKKERAKEQRLGAQKHEAAIKELNRRRVEQQSRKKPGGGEKAPVVAPARGAASGQRFKNKHMQEFDKMKNTHKKRKEIIARGGGQQDPRFTSNTAPARSVNIQKGGTATRRTDQPLRRASGGGNGGGATAPANIAVAGVGGLRALRNKGERL